MRFFITPILLFLCFLSRSCYRGLLGSGPLRWIIQELLREPLADYLLEKNPPAGTKIKVDVDGKELKIAEG
jgi:ATP-dependent Clp protease ATP-binding subunit ClpA